MQSLPSSGLVLSLRNGLYSGILVILAGQLAGAGEAVCLKVQRALVEAQGINLMNNVEASFAEYSRLIVQFISLKRTIFSWLLIAE